MRWIKAIERQPERWYMKVVSIGDAAKGIALQISTDEKHVCICLITGRRNYYAMEDVLWLDETAAPEV